MRWSRIENENGEEKKKKKNGQRNDEISYYEEVPVPPTPDVAPLLPGRRLDYSTPTLERQMSRLSELTDLQILQLKLLFTTNNLSPEVQQALWFVALYYDYDTAQRQLAAYRGNTVCNSLAQANAIIEHQLHVSELECAVRLSQRTAREIEETRLYYSMHNLSPEQQRALWFCALFYGPTVANPMVHNHMRNGSSLKYNEQQVNQMLALLPQKPKEAADFLKWMAQNFIGM